MGIGFGATAKAPTRNNRPWSRGDMFTAIRRAVEASCDDSFFAKLIDFGENEHELAVVLHPGAEAVFFTWDPSGSVYAACKTSTAGPGYHVYAVNVVKAVGERCGLVWEWEDEAEYAPDGDIAKVQEHMRTLLRAFAGSFLADHDHEGTLAVNMSMGAPTPLENGPFTITPLGPRDRAWWESIHKGADLDAAARMFYPWWNEERDAAFYLNMGLSLLWTEIRWRPPCSEREEAEAQLALECLERAAEMGAQVPIREMAELRALLELDDEEPAPIPAADGIGYHRAVIRHSLPGGWTVALPGYWGESFNEEDGCVTIFHNERAVHITTYGLDPHPGQPPPDPDEVAEFPKDIPKDAKNITFKADDVVGRAIVTRTVEDGAEGIILTGMVACPTGFAYITVWFEDDSDKAWAQEVFESVRGPASHG